MQNFFHSVYPYFVFIELHQIFHEFSNIASSKEPLFFLDNQEHAASSKTRGVEESVAVTTLERNQKVRTSKELKLTRDE